MQEPDDQISLPYVKGSATSKAAAFRHEPRAGSQRRRVLVWFYWNPGCTDDACQQATGMPNHSQAPRRWELEKGGWLARVDDKGVTRSGSKATRWRVTGLGREKMSQWDEIKSLPGVG